MTDQTQPKQSGYTEDEIVKTLHAADGLLSLVGYRYKDGVPPEVANDLQVTSGLCRSLVRRIEAARATQ